jgi:tRNA (guanine-N7-)-methyltransferase
MSQRMLLINSPVFVSETTLKHCGSIADLFGRHRPLELEIGCGIGDFIVQVAARHPDRNFLAIDIFNQGCKQTCARVEAAGLDNILVMRMEARFLMHQYLGPGSLRALYINCPDPWPKKRHRKRRLLNAEFVQLALYCLEDQGILNFCTDFADYGLSAAELLDHDPRLVNLHSAPFTNDLGSYPVSKYMRRFLDQGQPIYLCRYRKKADSVIAPPALSKGFRIPWPEEDA